MRFSVISRVFPLVLAATSASAATTSMVPTYDHIVVVIEENHSYNQIIRNSKAPYVNSLASAGALLTNSHAVAHPSEPNYFALYAGTTFGVTDDNTHHESDPTLYTILHNSGLSFIGYVDPSGSDDNHDPWYYFPEGTSVQENFDKSFPQNNFSSLPKVSFVIPGIYHDMHSASIAKGDAWLQQNLSAYVQWAQSNNSLLIVTFDENNGAAGNDIATVLDGAHIAPGTVDNTYYTHYNLLSTVLAAFNLTGPNLAATANHYQVFQP
jgi:phosphatidylinositol-3-phosphatase